MPFFPTVYASGGPFELGLQYGKGARVQVQMALRAYERSFRHFAGIDLRSASRLAREFLPSIEAFDPSIRRELTGIAEGAGVSLETILALNLRTEILLTARRLQGCTAVAVLPPAARDGHTLLAQNWDWMTTAQETSVLLFAEPEGGPAFVTFVEGGLLAKAGFNEAGLGVCFNALVTDLDRGEAGVPAHVLLRALYGAESVPEARRLIERAKRSSSGNYLLAHARGEALDLEADPEAVRVLEPGEGLLVHCNHFVHPEFSRQDVGIQYFPDSPLRYQRAWEVCGAVVGRVDLQTLMALFRDHTNYPHSVCCHPDPQLPAPEQLETAGSLLMDLSDRTLQLTYGPPCSAVYRTFRLEAARAKAGTEGEGRKSTLGGASPPGDPH